MMAIRITMIAVSAALAAVLLASGHIVVGILIGVLAALRAVLVLKGNARRQHIREQLRVRGAWREQRAAGYGKG